MENFKLKLKRKLRINSMRLIFAFVSFTKFRVDFIVTLGWCVGWLVKCLKASEAIKNFHSNQYVWVCLRLIAFCLAVRLLDVFFVWIIVVPVRILGFVSASPSSTNNKFLSMSVNVRRDLLKRINCVRRSMCCFMQNVCIGLAAYGKVKAI